jgi:4-hydroxybenzoyl-CoA reductase subunit beta
MKKRPEELLVDIQLPPTNGWRASYQKLRRRGAFDFPVLGVAAWIRYGTSTGRRIEPVPSVEEAKIILGAIAPSPVQVKEAERALIGQPLNDETIRAAGEACYIKARPLDNTDFVYQWRKQMARQYTIRALEELRRQGL